MIGQKVDVIYQGRLIGRGTVLEIDHGRTAYEGGAAVIQIPGLIGHFLRSVAELSTQPDRSVPTPSPERP